MLSLFSLKADCWGNVPQKATERKLKSYVKTENVTYLRKFNLFHLSNFLRQNLEDYAEIGLCCISVRLTHSLNINCSTQRSHFPCNRNATAKFKSHEARDEKDLSNFGEARITRTV